MYPTPPSGRPLKPKTLEVTLPDNVETWPVYAARSASNSGVNEGGLTIEA